MKKLLLGLGAVAAVVTPVVAVVSCGDENAQVKKSATNNAVDKPSEVKTGTEPTVDKPAEVKTGTEPTVDKPAEVKTDTVPSVAQHEATPSEKFTSALNEVVAYLKTPEGSKAQMIHINLGLLNGVNKWWFLEKKEDGKWNNSFREEAMLIFTMSQNQVNLTSLSNDELDVFLNGDGDAKEGVGSYLSDISVADPDAQPLPDGTQPTVEHAIDLICNDTIEGWVAKFTSLFDWASTNKDLLSGVGAAIGAVAGNVFSGGDSIKIQNSKETVVTPGVYGAAKEADVDKTILI